MSCEAQRQAFLDADAQLSQSVVDRGVARQVAADAVAAAETANQNVIDLAAQSDAAWDAYVDCITTNGEPAPTMRSVLRR